jgi:hypothetical protein
MAHPAHDRDVHFRMFLRVENTFVVKTGGFFRPFANEPVLDQNMYSQRPPEFPKL